MDGAPVKTNDLTCNSDPCVKYSFVIDTSQDGIQNTDKDTGSTLEAQLHHSRALSTPTNQMSDGPETEATLPALLTDQPHATGSSTNYIRRVDKINGENINGDINGISQEQYFAKIRSICQEADQTELAGPDPHVLAQHRRTEWPVSAALPETLAHIYDRVRASGLPNALGIRLQVPSGLNIENWERTFSYDSRHQEMLSFVKYGFPMGYLGPASPYDEQYNHSSAANYPVQIDKFIEKEISLGGIIGPMDQKPFQPWLHCSPMMSRPKRDSSDRRVIADLSYPEEASVNAYILRNAVWGETRVHSLPTVSEFVEKVKELGSNCYMATIDIA